MGTAQTVVAVHVQARHGATQEVGLSSPRSPPYAVDPGVVGCRRARRRAPGPHARTAPPLGARCTPAGTPRRTHGGGVREAILLLVDALPRARRGRPTMIGAERGTTSRGMQPAFSPCTTGTRIPPPWPDTRRALARRLTPTGLPHAVWSAAGPPCRQEPSRSVPSWPLGRAGVRVRPLLHTQAIGWTPAARQAAPVGQPARPPLRSRYSHRHH